MEKKASDGEYSKGSGALPLGDVEIVLLEPKEKSGKTGYLVPRKQALFSKVPNSCDFMPREAKQGESAPRLWNWHMFARIGDQFFDLDSVRVGKDSTSIDVWSGKTVVDPSEAAMSSASVRSQLESEAARIQGLNGMDERGFYFAGLQDTRVFAFSADDLLKYFHRYKVMSRKSRTNAIAGLYFNLARIQQGAFFHLNPREYDSWSDFLGSDSAQGKASRFGSAQQ